MSGGDQIDRQLAAIVLHFMPEAEGEELRWRIALMKARDFAGQLIATRDDEMAYELAQTAHDIAGRYAFADVPTVRLELATRLCRNLVQAAFTADHLASEAPYAD
ncbi:hypothetical protein GCM10023208_23630 [Erythrobacter westpacificensis]|uniref:Hpt domain-containing protein n=1 Tax=Erythrobacter westpacificensis TaxID=1055231 RepID=A0ABP9KIX1_9SPHN